MLTFLSILFFCGCAALAYWFWLRPLLATRPLFADFCASTDSFWAALTLKLNTIKTKLATGLGMIASAMIFFHDFVIPATTGINWTPVTEHVPSSVWPFLSFSYLALIFWFRQLTAKSQEVEISAVAAGATRQEAAVIAGKEPA